MQPSRFRVPHCLATCLVSRKILMMGMSPGGCSPFQCGCPSVSKPANKCTLSAAFIACTIKNAVGQKQNTTWRDSARLGLAQLVSSCKSPTKPPKTQATHSMSMNRRHTQHIHNKLTHTLDWILSLFVYGFASSQIILGALASSSLRLASYTSLWSTP